MFSFSNWNSVIKCKVKGWEISQFCIYNEIIDIRAVDQQISIKLEFDLLKDLSYKSKMEGMPWPTYSAAKNKSSKPNFMLKSTVFELETSFLVWRDIFDQHEDGSTRFLIFALFHKRFLPFLKALKNQNCPFLS